MVEARTPPTLAAVNHDLLLDVRLMMKGLVDLERFNV